MSAVIEINCLVFHILRYAIHIYISIALTRLYFSSCEKAFCFWCPPSKLELKEGHIPELIAHPFDLISLLHSVGSRDLSSQAASLEEHRHQYTVT